MAPQDIPPRLSHIQVARSEFVEECCQSGSIHHAPTTQKPKADHLARIGDLQREVGNLAEAIASGRLKSSPAVLAKRLTGTESELSRLQAGRG